MFSWAAVRVLTEAVLALHTGCHDVQLRARDGPYAAVNGPGGPAAGEEELLREPPPGPGGGRGGGGGSGRGRSGGGGQESHGVPGADQRQRHDAAGE